MGMSLICIRSTSFDARHKGNIQRICNSERLQPVEKRQLAGYDLLPRHRQIEPLGAIDFRKGLSESAPRRPFHFKCVAAHRRCIGVSLKRPGANKFAALLPNLSQVNERAGRREPRFFQEFALGGPNFGRAYDDGEMSADSGVAGSLELRYAVSTDRFMPNGAHVYSFIDGGRIWSRSDSAPLTRSNVSSIGAGMRANLSKTVYATFEVAKPTSGDVLTQGNKNPRVFFSISAQY